MDCRPLSHRCTLRRVSGDGHHFGTWAGSTRAAAHASSMGETFETTRFPCRGGRRYFCGRHAGDDDCERGRLGNARSAYDSNYRAARAAVGGLRYSHGRFPRALQRSRRSVRRRQRRPLVYARGFGYVNSAASVPEVSPTARFRIASSTKPMTAVAILRLVEDGAIRLDEYALDILHALTPPPGTTPDPRLRSITIRHLLEHSAGFVYPDAAGFDPQFDGLRLAALPFSHPFPATHTDIIRFALGRPLGFTPGTRYVYSNLGYSMLGRIIEA